MIQCIHNHGFSIKFDNHWEINALFSKHNNCSRYDQDQRGNQHDDAYEKTGIIKAFTVEVTITDNKGRAVVFDNDISLKHVTPKELADLIFKTSIVVVPTDITDFDLSGVRKIEDYE